MSRKPMPVKARGKLGGHDIEAEVVNPGNWFGRVWLVEIGCGYSSVFFAVEADSVTDAIDEFVDWEDEQDTTFARIDPDDESLLDDYGFEVSPGDIVGGKEIEEKGTMTLSGKFIPESEDPNPCISEPYTSGQGVYADLDNVMIHGMERAGLPWKCRYHFDALKHTPEGIDPRDFGCIDDSRID